MTTEDYMRDGLESFLEGCRREFTRLQCALCWTHDSDATPVRDTEVGRRCWKCTPDDVRNRIVAASVLLP